MEISELAKVLVALGCPAEKSAEMAAQLDKRARQLAGQKGRSYEEALATFADADETRLGAPRKKDFEFTIYDLRFTQSQRFIAPIVIRKS